jgi:hypothetical protein
MGAGAQNSQTGAQNIHPPMGAFIVKRACCSDPVTW